MELFRVIPERLDRATPVNRQKIIHAKERLETALKTKLSLVSIAHKLSDIGGLQGWRKCSEEKALTIGTVLEGLGISWELENEC